MDEQPRLNLVQRFFRFIQKFFFWVVAVVALLLIAGSYEAGVYSVYHAHPEISSTEQAVSVLTNVGKLIQLPNETPTMAAIKDAASVKKGQPFLVNSQDGDILIVYPNAAEAILYRPSTNKLINVGPVSGGNSGGVAQQTAPAPVATTSTNDASSTKSKK